MICKLLKTLFGDKHDLETERPLSPNSTGPANFRKDVFTFLYCFGGLQASYLIWGIIQEKMMSEVIHNGHEKNHISINQIFKLKNKFYF